MSPSAPHPDPDAGTHRAHRRPTGLESLTNSDESELAQAREGRQLGGREGSVGQRRGLPDGCARTSIFRRPRRPQLYRRADQGVATETVNCEDPTILTATKSDIGALARLVEQFLPTSAHVNSYEESRTHGRATGTPNHVYGRGHHSYHRVCARGILLP